ncbi:UDP-glucose 6-dehydrogenase [Corchorus capsularis]|uniref:UDP-glucose 6-dehydrogenase n=1 Tax=Corchorus capsularis TaxID=210143 RepID=A0A1R3GCN7_COCAP|nr:UDP-glucose 6-dehydrogenase [Corchorus capsularis]
MDNVDNNMDIVDDIDDGVERFEPNKITGLLITVMMARFWPQANVTVADHCTSVLHIWQFLIANKQPPIRELRFTDYFNLVQDRINFIEMDQHSEDELIKNARLIILAIEKEPKTIGYGQKGVSDLTDCEIAVKRIASPPPPPKHLHKEDPPLNRGVNWEDEGGMILASLRFALKPFSKTKSQNLNLCSNAGHLLV